MRVIGLRVGALLAVLVVVIAPSPGRDSSGASTTELEIPQSCAETFASPTTNLGLALNGLPHLDQSEVLLFNLPVSDGYVVAGGVATFDSSGVLLDGAAVAQVLLQSVGDHLARKTALVQDPGSAPSDVDVQDAANLSAALSGGEFVYTGWETECSSSVPVEVAAASIPCPGILQGNPFFPICPKDYMDRDGWAPDHGYWDFHWYGGSGTQLDHVLYMYNRWSSASRLSFYDDNRTGFEINTYVGSSSPSYAIATGSTVFAWVSDFPGAYRETLTFDDDSVTWAIGSDQAEFLVAGRTYQSSMYIRATAVMDGGLSLGLYGQVDVDMVTNGDAGFFVDQSCCSRDMISGDYQSW